MWLSFRRHRFYFGNCCEQVIFLLLPPDLLATWVYQMQHLHLFLHAVSLSLSLVSLSRLVVTGCNVGHREESKIDAMIVVQTASLVDCAPARRRRRQQALWFKQQVDAFPFSYDSRASLHSRF